MGASESKTTDIANTELSFVWKGRGMMQTTITDAQRPPGANSTPCQDAAEP